MSYSFIHRSVSFYDISSKFKHLGILILFSMIMVHLKRFH
jgi:hypothetical protein